MSAHVYVESLCCAEEATMPRARLWLCSTVTVCPTALVLAVICTNKAVLDVGLLSLHDLRADSSIRPIASRSVIQLLSNHCHFNNHIFSAYFFYLARGRGPNYNGNASRLFSLFCNLMKCTVTVF